MKIRNITAGTMSVSRHISSGDFVA